MAIQDVIVLPGFEYGTSIRVYNSVTKAWDVAYCFAGKIMRFEARREQDKIVLTGVENRNRKWVFVHIGASEFHWQDITVKENGAWQVDYDLYAERVK